MSQDSDDNNLKARVEQRLLHMAVRRIRSLSYAFSGMFVLFSLGIVPTLRHFHVELSFQESFLKRILLTSLPWFSFGYFTKKSSASDRSKLIGFALIQGLLFNISGVIDIWPTALSGEPNVLLGVTGINAQYIIVILSFAAVPSTIAFRFYAISIFTLLPGLAWVLFQTNNYFVITTVLNDTLFSLASGILGATLLAKILYQFEFAEISRESHASKFLGKDLHAAIFENKKDLLEEKLARGFVLSLDIRDSSRLTKENGERWTLFLKEWMAIAPGLIEHRHGKLLKTAGDSLLVTFGVFEEDVDLSDIPGLEREVANADERRWAFLTRNTLLCSEELINNFQALANKHFPDQQIRIGAGIDRGKVWKGVRGSEIRKELDIWGDSVNCASRLESYSKSLLSKFNSDSSLLVMSPYAVDYFDGFEGFVKVDTRSEIKDFSGIKWVLVREFRHARVAAA